MKFFCAIFFCFHFRVGEIFDLLTCCTMCVGILCLVFMTLGAGAGTFPVTLVTGYKDEDLH